MKLNCAGCGDEFDARRSTAKWCSDRCRKANARKQAAASESTVDQADGSDHKPTAETEYGRDILNAVRRDLEKVGRLDTVEGRVAMYLARKSIAPDCKSPAAMFKEMRAALAIALEGAEDPGKPEPATPPENEVEKARRKRAEKASGVKA